MDGLRTTDVIPQKVGRKPSPEAEYAAFLGITKRQLTTAGGMERVSRMGPDARDILLARYYKETREAQRKIDVLVSDAVSKGRKRTHELVTVSMPCLCCKGSGTMQKNVWRARTKKDHASRTPDLDGTVRHTV